MMNNQEIVDGRNLRRALWGVLAVPLLMVGAQTATAQVVKVQFNGPQPVQFNGPQPVQLTGPQPVQSANVPPALVNNQNVVPVLTRNIDEQGRRPFQYMFSCEFAGGTAPQPSCDTSFSIPQNQTVVIEYVNFSGFFPGLQPGGFELYTTAGGADGDYWFFPTPLGLPNQYAGSQMVHIAADPGSTIEFTGWASRPPNFVSGSAFFQMVISGYTVSVP